MRNKTRMFWLCLISFGLIGCSIDSTTTPPATLNQPYATSTIQGETSITPSATEPKPLATQVPVAFHLGEPGPYWTGKREYTLFDESREGRKIRLTIWYPAMMQTDADGKEVPLDALPDMSGAPYPLVLTEPNSGDILFKSHLASHGFVTAIVRLPDHYDNWDFGVIDHPRDMLFALDQIASNFPEGLEGVFDSDRVGVSGYSWGGFYALGVSGVRIDPEFYIERCTEAPSMEPELKPTTLQYYCNLSEKWEEFVARAGEEMTTSGNRLWKPLTDPRVRAVAPLAPDGAWLYGESGLAAGEIPTLIIVGTEDTISSYSRESVYIFEHLGTPDRFLISYIGKGHFMVFSSEPSMRMKHFVTAFFGYYLQGREDYKYYFSEDFVKKVDDLAWGVYQE